MVRPQSECMYGIGGCYSESGLGKLGKLTTTTTTTALTDSGKVSGAPKDGPWLRSVNLILWMHSVTCDANGRSSSDSASRWAM